MTYPICSTLSFDGPYKVKEMEKKKDNRVLRCGDCNRPLEKARWFDGHAEEWKDHENRWAFVCGHFGIPGEDAVVELS